MGIIFDVAGEGYDAVFGGDTDMARPHARLPVEFRKNRLL
jgi:hypothetical protein